MTQMDWQVVMDIVDIVDKASKNMTPLLTSLESAPGGNTGGIHTVRLFLLFHRHNLASRIPLSSAIDVSQINAYNYSFYLDLYKTDVSVSLLAAMEQHLSLILVYFTPSDLSLLVSRLPLSIHHTLLSALQ